MNKLSQKRQKIIAIILEKGATRSSSIYSEMVKLEEDISLKRIRAAYY
jgi:Fe2+ or Zn2+ uptake regulation protein